MKKTEEIDGWFNYDETFNFLINTIPEGGKFAECGAWLGRSSSYLCDTIANHRPDITPYIIDSWQGSIDELETFHKIATETDIYKIFLENMGDRKFEHLRALSVDACKQFPDEYFDVIFIDMCHAYEFVKQDLEIWYPKLKYNGYFAGHDISSPGVSRAVAEKFKEILYYPGDCWVVKKRKETK